MRAAVALPAVFRPERHQAAACDYLIAPLHLRPAGRLNDHPLALTKATRNSHECRATRTHDTRTNLLQQCTSQYQTSAKKWTQLRTVDRGKPRFGYDATHDNCARSSERQRGPRREDNRAHNGKR